MSEHANLVDDVDGQEYRVAHAAWHDANGQAVEAGQALDEARDELEHRVTRAETLQLARVRFSQAQREIGAALAADARALAAYRADDTKTARTERRTTSAAYDAARTEMYEAATALHAAEEIS